MSVSEPSMLGKIECGVHSSKLSKGLPAARAFDFLDQRELSPRRRLTLGLMGRIWCSSTAALLCCSGVVSYLPMMLGLGLSGGRPGAGRSVFGCGVLSFGGGFLVRDGMVRVSWSQGPGCWIVRGAMDLALLLFDNCIGRKRNVDGGVLAGLVGLLFASGWVEARDKTLTVTLGSRPSIVRWRREATLWTDVLGTRQ